MREELLDDELSIDESDYHYLGVLRTCLPAIKLLSIILLVDSSLSGVSLFQYYFFSENGGSSSIFNLLSWWASDAIVFIIGYKLWQQHKKLSTAENNAFETNEMIWMETLGKVWRLFAALVLINLANWLFFL